MPNKSKKRPFSKEIIVKIAIQRAKKTNIPKTVTRGGEFKIRFLKFCEENIKKTLEQTIRTRNTKDKNARLPLKDSVKLNQKTAQNAKIEKTPIKAILELVYL